MKPKIILLTFLFFFISLHVKCIEIKTPGTLSSLLTEQQKASLTSLQVEGPINSYDLSTLNAMPLLAHIDLSKVTAIDGENDIPHGAFKSNKVLCSIIFPPCLRDIAYSSFSGCINLQQIDFSRCVNLRNIGGGYYSVSDGAFKNCSSLTALDFKGCTSLQYIGIGDFRSCTALETIDFSDCIALKHLDGSFPGCTALRSVNLSRCSALVTIDGNPLYSGTFYGCNALKNINLSGCTALKNINYLAFSNCTALEEIDLTPCISLETLDASFKQCTALRKVMLPQNCVNIEAQTFYYCDSLSEINLPDALKVIGEKAFYGCKSLKAVHIPEGVSTLGNMAFEQCTSLSKVSIPSTITQWGQSIFERCSQLSDVKLSEGLQDLGPYMFAYCTSLENITLPQSLTVVRGFSSSFNNTGCGLKSIVIPDEVVEIADNAFMDCKALSQVVMGKKVAKIGNNAFSGTAIKRVVVPPLVTQINYRVFSSDSLQEVILHDNITTISSYAFSACSALSSIQLPAKLSTLAVDAFNNCTALESVTISPDNLFFSASDGVLYNKDQTELIFFPIAKAGEYFLPEKITQLAVKAFYGRNKITSLHLHDGITEIPDGTIMYCSELNSITFPANLNNFDSRGLKTNPKLIELRIKSTQIPLWSLIWWPIPTKLSIYVPYGTLQLYQQHPNWSPYKSNIKEEADPTAVDFVQNKTNSFRIEKGNLLVNALKSTFLQIFALNGKLLYSGSIHGQTIIPITERGMLLLTIDGRSYKLHTDSAPVW